MTTKLKKLLPLLFITILSIGLMAACGGTSDGISSDEAKTIALEDSGYSEANVDGLRVSKDKDDNIEYYEVDFRAAGIEYSYEINVLDGSIISRDSETEDFFGADSVNNNGNTNNSGNNTNTNNNTANDNTNSGGNITQDEAVAIALAKVPGATQSNIVINEDWDDGRKEYEGTIIYNGVEYEFEIDATNGNIISWEETHK